MIGHIGVKDPVMWREHCSRVPATLAPWSAELVFRDQRAALLGGAHQRSDAVVLRFPDIAAAHGWFHSAAYQALIPLRQQAAEVDLISFEE